MKRITNEKNYILSNGVECSIKTEYIISGIGLMEQKFFHIKGTDYKWRTTYVREYRCCYGRDVTHIDSNDNLVSRYFR